MKMMSMMMWTICWMKRPCVELVVLVSTCLIVAMVLWMMERVLEVLSV